MFVSVVEQSIGNRLSRAFEISKGTSSKERDRLDWRKARQHFGRAEEHHKCSDDANDDENAAVRH